MVKIPKFLLYGQHDARIEGVIQPRLDLRNWTDLGRGEKKIAIQELRNRE
jgi:hypothetical protein